MVLPGASRHPQLQVHSGPSVNVQKVLGRGKLRGGLGIKLALNLNPTSVNLMLDSGPPSSHGPYWNVSVPELRGLSGIRQKTVLLTWHLQIMSAQ